MTSISRRWKDYQRGITREQRRDIERAEAAEKNAGKIILVNTCSMKEIDHEKYVLDLGLMLKDRCIVSVQTCAKNSLQVQPDRFELTRNACQALTDELWHRGFFPSNPDLGPSWFKTISVAIRAAAHEFHEVMCDLD